MLAITTVQIEFLTALAMKDGYLNACALHIAKSYNHIAIKIMHDKIAKYT